jgi:hypothetical protein
VGSFASFNAVFPDLVRPHPCPPKPSDEVAHVAVLDVRDQRLEVRPRQEALARAIESQHWYEQPGADLSGPHGEGPPECLAEQLAFAVDDCWLPASDEARSLVALDVRRAEDVRP